MSKLNNLEGQRFSYLIVIERTLLTYNSRHYYICLCDCGKYCIALGKNLSNNNTKSCGCYAKLTKGKYKRTNLPDNSLGELAGSRFGKLTVIHKIKQKSGNNCMYTCVCDCGNTKNFNASNLRRGMSKSCGCIAKSLVGINHPLWKGINSKRTVNKVIRQSHDYKLWRIEVFKRDNYSCQKCSIKNRTIQAHHINNFSDNKDLRTSILNGVTLCKHCHTEFHNLYSNKNNNYWQLTEFMYINNL